MLPPKEKELLDRFRKDDQSALKFLFDSYHVSLCVLAYRLVKDREAAKDVVQEVFVKFWKNRKATDINTSIVAYLKRAVINTSLNHIEKYQHYSKVQLDQLNKPPQVQSSDHDQASNELSMLLEEAVSKLPVRTRAVFILIRSEEMTYKEAAASLDISTKAVEKEMMKALKLLREMLKNFLPVILMGAPFI